MIGAMPRKHQKREDYKQIVLSPGEQLVTDVLSSQR
jgi:hypothetical protein